MIYADDPSGARPLFPIPVARTAEWGTDAPGCRPLAEAILRDATGEAAVAGRLSGPFSELLALLPSNGFALSQDEVLDWVTAQTDRKNGSPPVRAPAHS